VSTLQKWEEDTEETFAEQEVVGDAEVEVEFLLSPWVDGGSWSLARRAQDEGFQNYVC